MSARVAVILGATSDTGRSAMQRLAASGWQVLAATRRASFEPMVGVRSLQLDLSSSDASRQLLQAEAAAIVSVAPIFVAAPCLAGVLSQRPVRVVACSSMSAVSKRHSPSRGERRVAESLLQAEQTLRQSAAWNQCTILRPTMIYGGAENRNIARLQRLGRMLRVLPCPSEPTGLRQPVHRDDLAEALVRAIDAPAAAGHIIEIGGGEPITMHALIRRTAASVGAVCVPIPHGVASLFSRIPSGLVPGVGAGALKRLFQDQVADNAQVTRVLGIRPRSFQPERAP